MHEKGLQRKTGVRTLVSSQERRALAVALINCGSTARSGPPSVYIDFLCSCLQKDVQDSFPRYSGGLDCRLAYVPPDTSASCSARLAAPRRPAVRRADRHRPWYVRVLDSTGTKKTNAFYLLVRTIRKICFLLLQI